MDFPCMASCPRMYSGFQANQSLAVLKRPASRCDWWDSTHAAPIVLQAVARVAPAIRGGRADTQTLRFLKCFPILNYFVEYASTLYPLLIDTGSMLRLSANSLVNH